MLFNFLCLQTCVMPGYKRNLSSTEFAQSMTVTEEGARKYFGCVVSKATEYIQMMDIQDIVFDINLGVTKIQFQIADIEVLDTEFKSLTAAFLNDDFMRVAVDGAHIKIAMNWGFQQSSYPYLRDGGTGTLEIVDADAQIVMWGNADNPDCQNHYKIGFNSGGMRFSALKIDLQGGSSWIYQSLINVVLEAITDTLQQTFSDVVMKAVVYLITNSFEEDAMMLAYLPPYDNIIKDEREIGHWRVGYQYYCSKTSGYTYYLQDLSDEFMSADKITKYTMNQNAYDITFTVSSIAFQNQFYIFHKYHDLYSDPSAFKVLSMPIFEIKNTVASLEFDIEANGQKSSVTLLGQVKIRSIERPNAQNVTCNTTYIYMTYKFHSATGSLVDDVLADKIVKRQNLAQLETGYQLNSLPYMDVDMFQVVLDPKERVVRLVGDTEECV